MVDDPFVLSAFVSAFVASLFWLAAMTRFELSFAYPFMALSFVLVFIFSVMFVGESISVGKSAGVVLILIGSTAVVKF